MDFKKLIEQLNKIAEDVEEQSNSIEQEPTNMFNELFNNHPLFDSEFTMNNSVHKLLYDVIEEKEHILVVVDLPGFSEEQISIQSDEKQVRVSAEATEDMRRESVSHTFTLPDEVIPEDSEATFENGVLEITLPRVDVDLDDNSTTIDIS